MTEEKTKEPSKRVSMAHQILSWIKEGLVQNERDRQANRTTGTTDEHRSIFHAREGSGCQLRAYFRRTGVVERSSEKFRYLYLGAVGNAIEPTLLSAIGTAAGEQPRCQERGSRAYSARGITATVVGRIDALLKGVGGIEIKNVSDEEWGDLASIAAVRAGRPSHVAQALVYCWLFDLPRVFLLYVSRDDAKFRAFEIKRDKKREQEILEELLATEEAIQKKEPPSPKPGFQCYFCGYSEVCPAFGGQLHKGHIVQVTSRPDLVLADSGEEIRIPTT